MAVRYDCDTSTSTPSISKMRHCTPTIISYCCILRLCYIIFMLHMRHVDKHAIHGEALRVHVTYYILLCFEPKRPPAEEWNLSVGTRNQNVHVCAEQCALPGSTSCGRQYSFCCTQQKKSFCLDLATCLAPSKRTRVAGRRIAGCRKQERYE